MDSRKSRSSTTNFQDKFYSDHSYKKEERREGRSKIRRSESGHSKREASRSREKRHDLDIKLQRTASLKQLSRDQVRIPKERRNESKNANGWHKRTNAITENKNSRWTDDEVPNWKTHRKLISGMQLDFNLARRNMEKKLKIL